MCSAGKAQGGVIPIHWKIHFKSAPSEVYRALSTPLGRSRYWARSAKETDGVIRFVLPDGRTDDSRVERAVKDEQYALRYFGHQITFALARDDESGTDLTLSCECPTGSAANQAEWVSLLLRMKAAVDFGVDLRNHDPARTHAQGYVDL